MEQVLFVITTQNYAFMVLYLFNQTNKTKISLKRKSVRTNIEVIIEIM